MCWLTAAQPGLPALGQLSMRVPLTPCSSTTITPLQTLCQDTVVTQLWASVPPLSTRLMDAERRRGEKKRTRQLINISRECSLKVEWSRMKTIRRYYEEEMKKKMLEVIRKYRRWRISLRISDVSEMLFSDCASLNSLKCIQHILEYFAKTAGLVRLQEDVLINMWLAGWWFYKSSPDEKKIEFKISQWSWATRGQSTRPLQCQPCIVSAVLLHKTPRHW